MVSNARLDLPDPLTPVMTVNWLRGISAFMFLRLWTRAPRIEITSFDILPSPPVAAMLAVVPCAEPIDTSIDRDEGSNLKALTPVMWPTYTRFMVADVEVACREKQVPICRIGFWAG